MHPDTSSISPIGGAEPAEDRQFSRSSGNLDGLPFVATKREVAQVLRCTERHVENLTKRGLLKATHLGRCVRYRRDAILRSLDKLQDAP